MHHLAHLLAQAPNPGTAPADDTSLLVWGLVLLTTAVALVFAEMVVPSGGIISLAAAVTAVAGLVCLTFQDTTLGLWATLAVLIASPFVAGFMLKVWPNTPVGKMLILRDPPAEAQAVPGDPQNRGADNPGPALPAVGERGVAKTPLRPVGTCVISGQRIECLSEAGIIDADTAIEVVDVDGTEVRVKQVAS